MTDKVHMTPRGYESLQEDLRRLKTQERPKGWGARLFFDPEGKLQDDAVQAVVSRRDHRLVDLAE